LLPPIRIKGHGQEQGISGGFLLSPERIVFKSAAISRTKRGSAAAYSSLPNAFSKIHHVPVTSILPDGVHILMEY
jgi:hypothetical protein